MINVDLGMFASLMTSTLILNKQLANEASI
jgi:hypothetical protein